MSGDRGASAIDKRVIEAILSGSVYQANASGIGQPESISGTLLRELMIGIHGQVPFNGIRISGLTIAGDVDLSHLEWTGALELTSCNIEGDILLSFARIKGRIVLSSTRMNMLAFNHMHLDGSLIAKSLDSRKTEIKRGVFGLGSTISGSLSLQSSIVEAPRENERHNRAAVDIYRASVGDLYLNRAVLRGGLYAVGLTVSRNIRIPGTEVWSRAALNLKQGPDASDGVDLAAATIGSTIYLWSSVSGPLMIRGKGSVSLSSATCRRLQISADQTRELSVNFNGLRYRSLGPATGRDLLLALDKASPFPSKAYSELARHADEEGDLDIKRKTLISQQARISTSFPFWSFSRLRRRAFGLLVGYGYAPGRAIAWLAGCVLAASYVLQCHGGFVRPKPGSPELSGWPQATTLAADNLLPFVSLNFKEQWLLSPTGSDQWDWFIVLIIIKLAAWVLSALAVGAVTGLIRRT